MVDSTEPPQKVIKKETSSFILPSLPDEIIVHILSFLPVKSILRSRCVCKNWCNKLFKDPKFIKLHLNHAIGSNKFISLLKTGIRAMYSVDLYHTPAFSLVHNEHAVEIDSPLLLAPEVFMHCNSFDRVRIFGTCNGLILMNNPRWSDNIYGTKEVIIWNPATKEIKEIPGPVLNSSVHMCDEFGFGYSPVLDDYKIVRATISYTSGDFWIRVSNGFEAKVYSLRSNSWKTIPYVIPYNISFFRRTIKPVTYNGALHWIGTSSLCLIEGMEVPTAVSIVILSFDIENETFREVFLTLELQESLCYNSLSYKSSLSERICLGNFRGCLSVVVQGSELDSGRNNNSDISIWVMKEYGVRESWSKMFSVTKQSMERSIQCSQMTLLSSVNGMVIFLKDKTSLVLYDPEHETAQEVVNILGLSEDWSYVETFVGSLTSLNSGTCI